MKSIFYIINGFLIILSGYFCTNIFYKSIVPDAVAPLADDRMLLAPDTADQPSTKSGLNRQKNNAIARRNLFKVEVEKQSSASRKPVEKRPEKLEPTHLKLSLWGTVTGGGEKYAVIEDKKAREQSLYLVGDMIQGAKLKEILRQKVVLEFEGRDQVLEMETDTRQSSVSPIRRKIQTPSIQAPVVPSFQKLPSLDQLPENLGDIMRQIKFRPHFNEGEPDGLMVYGIRPNSIFREVGLRNGDIVKDINGTPVNTPEDAVSLFEEIMNSDQSKVTLFRRGETKELVYQMNGEEDAETEDAVLEEDNGGDN